MAEKIVLRAFQVWSATLGLGVVYGITFAIYSLITGNYTGTASFEF
jgi:hypothetical protein